MKIIKYGLVAGALIGTFILGEYVGDKTNFNDRRVYPNKYENVKVNEKFYQDPFSLRKTYRLNEVGELEVYFGVKGNEFPVTNELRVNERKPEELKKERKSVLGGIINSIDNFFDNSLDQ